MFSRHVAVDKTPGLDGYTMGFFVHCWEVLKNDVISTMHKFVLKKFSRITSMQLK